MIEKFVALLAPSIERDKLLSHVDVVKEQLVDSVLPAYKAALQNNLFSRSYKPRSQWMMKKSEAYDREVRPSNMSMAESIVYTLEKISPKLDWIRKQIEQNFEPETYREGITYPKAALIELFEALAFEVRYAREFLLAMYSYEVPEYWPDNSKPNPVYAQADLRRIDLEFLQFTLVAGVINKTKNIEGELENIPDVVVDVKGTSGANALVGHARTAPLTMGFISPEWNPIYSVGKWWAERQVKALNKAKAEKQALDLYLIQLKNSRDGRPNAAVEKQIERLSGDIQKLGYEIEETESRYLRRG